jgi:hypothetical protein
MVFSILMPVLELVHQIRYEMDAQSTNRAVLQARFGVGYFGRPWIEGQAVIDSTNNELVAPHLQPYFDALNALIVIAIRDRIRQQLLEYELRREGDIVRYILALREGFDLAPDDV